MTAAPATSEAGTDRLKEKQGRWDAQLRCRAQDMGGCQQFVVNFFVYFLADFVGELTKLTAKLMLKVMSNDAQLRCRAQLMGSCQQFVVNFFL